VQPGSALWQDSYGQGIPKPMSDSATATKQRIPAVAEPAGRVRLGKLDQYVGFHLRLAQQASFKAFKRRTGEDDLRPGWFAVLTLIDENPGITPIALSRASGRDKSTLTAVLRDLLRARFIVRQPMPRDRRSHALFLTPLGEEKLARLALHAARHDRLLDEIVGARKTELIKLLRRIAMLLE
jgi:DNA-binding MarR family transcriptional regulator